MLAVTRFLRALNHAGVLCSGPGRSKSMRRSAGPADLSASTSSGSMHSYVSRDFLLSLVGADPASIIFEFIESKLNLVFYEFFVKRRLARDQVRYTLQRYEIWRRRLVGNLFAPRPVQVVFKMVERSHWYPLRRTRGSEVERVGKNVLLEC